MEMLLADLKAHHSDVAARIIGSVVVDAHHTTENQLLAKAQGVLRRVQPEINRAIQSGIPVDEDRTGSTETACFDSGVS